MRFVKETVKNMKDVDIYVKDCFGEEYVIFPGHERKIVVLENTGAKNDRKRSGR